jgi:hypothetical protein
VARHLPSSAGFAQSLVAVCEEVLLPLPKGTRGDEQDTSWLAIFSALAAPLALLSLGSRLVRRKTVVAMIVLAAAAALFNFLVQPTFALDASWQSQVNAALLMMFVAAIFLPTPSGFGFGSYTHDDLRRAYARIKCDVSIPSTSIDEHRLLLSRAEHRSRQRVSALQWMLGAAWAIVLYFGQRGFETKDADLVSMAIGPALPIVLLLGVLVCYQRGLGAVYGLAHALLTQLALDTASANSGRRRCSRSRS